ncbi:MBL fold metallo-hydrolase [Stutzerimonas nitrititolerans]|uniref:MBL fold metallo-hydrolase n=2 Tax=Pseudomonadaceae TaxID=135621 RepID=UPI0028B19D9E|nr:rhodanese-like domain-containing protein [Stutzerimonas nitrititolerans]
MLVFESIYTEGLAQISYLVGDSKAAVAAVIDPRRDVEVYLDLARDKGLRIAYAIETHIHADFVSGAQALAERCGAEIIGGLRLRAASGGRRRGAGTGSGQPGSAALARPHPRAHLRDSQQGEAPFALFTGDTLFNLDVGRPDLLGEDSTKQLAAQLYATLFTRYLPLGERIEIYPCHGAGSACGKSIGDRRHSTLGNELLFNPALNQRRTEQEFVDWLLDGMPEPPRHYARLKQLNARPLERLHGPALPPPLAPEEFRQRTADHDAVQLVDVRSILAFGGGHVPGALNIALRDEFASWAGWMLDDQRPIYLIGEDSVEVHQATLQLYRIGLDQVAGYLRNGMTDWQNAGLPLACVMQWTVHELDRRRGDPEVQVLDVRSPEEVAQGRVPGARHAFVAHLPQHLEQLDRDGIVAVYCGSGYRASIAASLLKRHGFNRVANVPGSWAAWRKHDLPVAQR